MLKRIATKEADFCDTGRNDDGPENKGRVEQEWNVLGTNLT
jgi:hypothetical protein